MMVMAMMVVIMIVMVMLVMMLIFVMVVVVVIMVVKLFSLYGLNPSCRGGHLIKVEGAGVDKGIEVAEVARHNVGVRLYLVQDGGDACQLVRGNHRSLVQQYLITELNLLYHEAGQVVFANILAHKVVALSKLVAQAQCVAHRHNGVELSHALDGKVRIHLWIHANGLCNGGGLANAAGLNHNIVETLLRHQVAELLHEVHLQGAANASVLQGHKAVVAFAHNASLLNKVGIDVYLANVVYNHGKAYAFLVSQYTV